MLLLMFFVFIYIMFFIMNGGYGHRVFCTLPKETSQVQNEADDTAENAVKFMFKTDSAEKTQTKALEIENSAEKGSADYIKENYLPSSYYISNFNTVLQMPELPTGCEITAMTMVLNYYGYNVDKETMATDYLPTVPAAFYYGEDGRRYGPDMNRHFVGSPATELGYICGPEAIVTAANSYLRQQNSQLTAVNRTGTTTEELYRFVSNDMPVVVWVTIGMADRNATQGWYTYDGEYMEWSTNDHGAVLIGYTEDTVTIADPIYGKIEYDRQQFEKVFRSRYSQCVILENME